MVRTFGEHLRQEIRKDIDAITDALSTGAATSFDQYTHYTGVLKGLAQADRLVLDLIEAAEKTSNDN